MTEKYRYPVHLETPETETAAVIDYEGAFNYFSEAIEQKKSEETHVEIKIDEAFKKHLGTLSMAVLGLRSLTSFPRHPDTITISEQLGYGRNNDLTNQLSNGINSAEKIIAQLSFLQVNNETVHIFRHDLRNSLFVLKFQQEIMGIRHEIDKIPGIT